VPPVANTPLESPSLSASRGTRALRFAGESYGAAVLACSIPFLFIHERFQPEASATIGSTSVDVRTADLAVLAVVVTAIVVLVGSGTERLRAGRPLWVTGALLLTWLAFQALRPASLDDENFADHLVTYLKLVEYALLAVAVPVLIRCLRDLAILVGGLVVWGAVATLVAVLQFFGSGIFEVSTSGWRYSSFLGRHDLAALSVIAASLVGAAIVARRGNTPVPSLVPLAAAGGTLGLVLAGSVTAAAGFALGAVALAVAARQRFRPSRRRFLALAAVVLAVAVGVVAIRSEALDDFLGFLGIRGAQPAEGVETYSQRTVLTYIGLRVFLDRPVIGAGWQRSASPEIFEPYVDDARRRFPDVADLAFPARGREWGVQNLYVQTLADAGLVGLVLLLAVGGAGLTLGWRTARLAPTNWAVGAGLTSLCALIALAAEWASLGIVSGIPIQAATGLVLGLAAAGAASVEDAAV
jgi:O-antigen ligase